MKNTFVLLSFLLCISPAFAMKNAGHEFVENHCEAFSKELLDELRDLRHSMNDADVKKVAKTLKVISAISLGSGLFIVFSNHVPPLDLMTPLVEAIQEGRMFFPLLFVSNAMVTLSSMFILNISPICMKACNIDPVEFIAKGILKTHIAIKSCANFIACNNVQEERNLELIVKINLEYNNLNLTTRKSLFKELFYPILKTGNLELCCFYVRTDMNSNYGLENIGAYFKDRFAEEKCCICLDNISAFLEQDNIENPDKTILSSGCNCATLFCGTCIMSLSPTCPYCKSVTTFNALSLVRLQDMLLSSRDTD